MPAIIYLTIMVLEEDNLQIIAYLCLWSLDNNYKKV